MSPAFQCNLQILPQVYIVEKNGNEMRTLQATTMYSYRVPGKGMMLGERKYIWKKWIFITRFSKVSLEPSSPSEMKQAKTGDKAFLGPS